MREQASPPDDSAVVLDVLATGDLTIEGRLTVASNLTLLGTVTAGDQSVTCVYKPVAGERPLWDFPDGSLAGREVAAYEISAAAGWQVVPPTVMRREGPFGPGMCQLWIEHDAGVSDRRWVDIVGPREVPDGWLSVLRAVDGEGNPVVVAHADAPALRRIAIFDVVVNNADRKGGHLLSAGNRGLAPAVGVDHGVSFHVEPKLRTVLWGWAGSAVTNAERDELHELRRSLVSHPLRPRLEELITDDEVDAIEQRINALLDHGTMPEPAGRIPVPWPVF